MITCPKCKSEIESSQRICPRCGYQLTSPDELANIADFLLKKIGDTKVTSLDLSPQGQVNTLLYAKKATTLIKPLVNLLEYATKTIAEGYERKEDTTKIIERQTNIFGELGAGIQATLMKLNFLNEMNNCPPGCERVCIAITEFVLVNIELVNSIIKFFDQDGSMDLRKVGQIFYKTSLSTNNVYEESTKLMLLLQEGIKKPLP